ncbi:MAG: electron transport complex subunit RsxA [Gammaproteobacteria bacterium]|nr:MAG: electron transport complex subunit RsxA [Gammaproteobacteria bacterium]
MEEIFLVLISSALVNNIVVAHVIGTDPALVATQRRDVARGISCLMLILLPLTTVIASATSQLILIPLQLQYLQTFVFVMLIIMIVYGLRLWPKLWPKSWSGPFGKSGAEMFLPLAGVNVTVLGTLLLNQQQDNNLFYSFIFGLGTAIGFALMLALLTAINTRLEMADVPAPFKGLSITLLTLGLISMAFLGFSGLVK